MSLVARRRGDVGMPGRRYVTLPVAAWLAQRYGGQAVDYVGKYMSRKVIDIAKRAYNSSRRKRSYQKSYKKPRYNNRKSYNKSVYSQIRRAKKCGSGELTYRDLSYQNWTFNQGAIVYKQCSMNTGDLLQQVIAQLRYYDPAAPTNLVTADGEIGTYQKEFHFKRTSLKVYLCANYKVPVEVRLYWVRPRADTSITAIQSIIDGLQDSCNRNSAYPGVYPTDAPEFNDLYKIEKSYQITLHPGKTYTTSIGSKPFDFDTAYYDHHNLNYQSRHKSKTLLVRMVGPIGHDGTTGAIAPIAGEVDVRCEYSATVQYDAGGNIKYTYVTSDHGTFTTAPATGRVTQKPEAVALTTGT